MLHLIDDVPVFSVLFASIIAFCLLLCIMYNTGFCLVNLVLGLCVSIWSQSVWMFSDSSQPFFSQIYAYIYHGNDTEEASSIELLVLFIYSPFFFSECFQIQVWATHPLGGWKGRRTTVTLLKGCGLANLTLCVLHVCICLYNRVTNAIIKPAVWVPRTVRS